MGFIDWFFYEIVVSRRLTNAYFFIMLIISLLAFFLMYKMKFKRFSIYLWLISGLICLFWELYLFVTGSRTYNFLPALELPYHALTEAGPGLIIMILFAHKIKLIDISEYSDDYDYSKKRDDETELEEEEIILVRKKKKKTRTVTVEEPEADSELEDEELDEEYEE